MTKKTIWWWIWALAELAALVILALAVRIVFT